MPRLGCILKYEIVKSLPGAPVPSSLILIPSPISPPIAQGLSSETFPSSLL